jgi:hypothetical protein
MVETLIENFKQLLTNPGVVLVGAVTLIQIAPIKINPWSWLRKTLSDLIYGEVRKDISAVKEEVTEMKVQNWRWNVLDFANSCKNGRRHTLDEWRHTMSQLAEYERYIERNEITNGVFEEDAKYLREAYQEHCRLNDFL